MKENKRYFIAFMLGVVGGGILVAAVSKVLPKMMAQMMAGMMQTMMRRMEAEGRDPMDMCRQMMARCVENQKQESQASSQA